MAVTFGTINIKDALHTFRTTINSNFSAAKTKIDALENVINLSTLKVTGNDLLLQKGERALSTELFINEASGRIKGNFVVEGTSTVGNLTLLSGKTVTLPVTTMTFTGESVLTLSGRLHIDGLIVETDWGNSAIDGSAVASYVSVSENIGTLSIAGQHAMIINFANYDDSVDEGNVNYVEGFIIEQGSYQGQRLTLLINAAASSAESHTIGATNISSLAVDENITVSGNNAIVDLVYVGSSWKIISLFGATIV